MSETRKIDVIIPTYHPDEKLEKCLRMLKDRQYSHRGFS